MGVSVSTLKSDIKAAMDAEKVKQEGQDASIDRIAARIAEAVAKQIVQGVNTATVVPLLTSSMGPVTGTVTITATIDL